MRRALCAALICAPTLVQAQDLGPALADIFTPVEHVENVSDTLNCTALYRSLSLVLGDESELSDGFRQREGFMASIAGLLWVAAEGVEGQTPDDVFSVLIPLINSATDQYLSHMDTVAAQTDAPFDDLILDQVDFCNAIYEALQSDPE